MTQSKPSRLIDPYSVSSFPITMYFDDTELSVGTAFFWKRNGETLLITNRHNLTGMDNNTGRHLHPSAAEPNRICALCVSSRYVIEKFEVFIDIYKDGEPIWLVHPQHGAEIDVVAIPLVLPPQAQAHHINELPNFPQMDVSVGSDVFILGYPFGMGMGLLPIWKKGSLATEPALIGATRERYFLIDTASRPGMSGSPVIRRASGAVPQMGGGIAVGTGNATKFLGVYSGRLAPKDSLDASLGIAWPAELVHEIVAANRRDRIR